MASPRHAWLAVANAGLYVLVVLLPVAVLLVSSDTSGVAGPPLLTFGRITALVGYAMLAMQFVIAARLKWMERPFGLDRLMRFHKWLGVTAGILVVSHPLFLVVGGAGWGLIFSTKSHWPIVLGKLAMMLLFVQVVISIYRFVLRLEFQKWRLAHDLVAPALLGLGLVHGWTIGSDMQATLMRSAFVAYTTAAAAGLLYTRVLGPLLRRNRAFNVVSVRQETHNVWTIEMAPPPGRKVFDYLPGQFQFVTLCRGRGLPSEEHPFTISSSPARQGIIASTVKASGDYTSTTGRTQPGHAAVLEGPFGRFSYLLYPGEDALVFIAGGIGITPLMSMLRHMHDTGDAHEVLLLYANRSQRDIAFREELDAIRDSGKPRLTVIHVLNDPDAAWNGERGRIDEEKLRRFCGDLSGKAFYVCGPPPMMMSLVGTLKRLGVPRSLIHYELFSL